MSCSLLLQRSSGVASTSSRAAAGPSYVSPLLASNLRTNASIGRTPSRQGLCSTSSPLVPSAPCRTRSDVRVHAFDPKDKAGADAAGGLQAKLNPVYLALVGVYAGLFALKNPYIFAALSIATIIPQNSTVTSLNSLVLFFYESGLFMSFAEAVYCVRLLTWLSIGCCLVSFAVFS